LNLLRVPTSRLLSLAVVCAVGAFAVALFFRYQIADGFSLLNGDVGDQVIEISILEHWYNVFRGFEHWQEPVYLYPVRNTLGYDDGYFLFRCIHALFRAVGIDPYLSAELVTVVLRMIGFFSFYLAMRWIFSAHFVWALLGATLFALSNSVFVQAVHAQLFGVSLVPVMSVLLYQTISAMNANRRARMLIWGAVSAALYAAWLMTSFYMAWYFLLYSSVALIVYLLVGDRASVSRLMASTWRHLLPCSLIVLVLLVFSIPFFATYLPKADETGMHPYSEAFSYTPSLFDVINVGKGNLLFGRLIEFINRSFRPDFPAYSERTTGFNPVLLVLFGAGALSLWRNRRSPGGRCDSMLLVFALAAVATWVLTIHVRSASLWWYVYSYFPGAKAARTVSRYQIFLAAPVITVATLYLAAQSRRTARAIPGLISALLVLGELNTEPPRAIDRHRELAWLTSVPTPPAQCRVFFVSQGRAEGTGMDRGLTDNVAAMIIAEVIHLPTPNGWVSFIPTGWALFNPGSDDYLHAVRRFADDNRMSGLCGLDLRHMQWSLNPLPGSG
jgi:hypothetical protein